MTTPTRFRRLALLLMLCLSFTLACALRLRGAPAAMALADSISPWWVAWGSPWPASPHAAPYGAGLYTPYALCLTFSNSLWQATVNMLTLHAFIAPLGAWAAWRIRPGSLAAPLVVGVLLATDAGLLDTALSGSEGYLGALWLGVVALSVTGRRHPWSPIVAGAAFAMAVMNHPLALCAAPLLALLSPRRRSTWLGLATSALLLAPMGARLIGQDTGITAETLTPWVALDAWLDQGGLAAWAILAGPLIGLTNPRTRSLAVVTLAAAALLGLGGHWLGYLRDHHLRLLTVPALLGWAALPEYVPLLALLLLRAPVDLRPAPGHPQRPGTLGLTTQLADTLARQRAPLVVDGLWLSGAPAAEPAALTLDLHLRGWPPAQLAHGGQVALVVSHRRDRPPGLAWTGETLDQGDHHALILGAPEDLAHWTAALCAAGGASQARAGGAQDAMSMLHPSLPVPERPLWWGC